MGTHLVGAIIHRGQAQNGKEIFGSFDYYQFPHGSNLTMTVLLGVLVYRADEYDLPPVLYNNNNNLFTYIAQINKKLIKCALQL